MRLKWTQPFKENRQQFCDILSESERGFSDFQGFLVKIINSAEDGGFLRE